MLKKIRIGVFLYKHINIWIFLRAVSALYFILFPILSFSQNNQPYSVDNKKSIERFQSANVLVKKRQFTEAIEIYQKLIQKHPDFIEVYGRLSGALRTLGLEDSAIQYDIQYIEQIQPTKASSSLVYRIGNWYFENAQYEKADSLISNNLTEVAVDSLDQAFKLLIQSVSFSKNNLRNVDLLQPVALPNTVNSYFTQYFPAITVDGNTLIFTKRDGDKVYHDESLMISNRINGSWQPSTLLSKVFYSRNNEGAPTISADGRMLIFTSCDEGITMGSCDLFISYKTQGSWTKPLNLGPSVNSIYWDSQPSLSADGQQIYFSSNRPGGIGKRDLYVTQFDDSGWQIPKNLGSKINSVWDEVTPSIHANGQQLVFSSNGHPGFGKFDLFISSYSDSVWERPQNLGYGINDHLDQVSFIVDASGDHAYFSKDIKNDNGAVTSKIYIVDLTSSTKRNLFHPANYLLGKTFDAVTRRPIKAEIELYYLENAKRKYRTWSDEDTGNFLFVADSTSHYGIYATSPGYSTYDLQLDSIRNPEDSLFIYLAPIVKGTVMTFNTLYFEFDSYEITQGSMVSLQKLSHIIKTNNYFVRIEGHTDEQGDDIYNMNLSLLRAKAVYNYLIQHGVESNKLSFKGLGSSNPKFTNPSEKHLNRRIEFHFIEKIL